MGIFDLGVNLATGALRRLEAETAHKTTIRLLKTWGPLIPPCGPDDPRLAVQAFGMNFPNPVGLAAGFDVYMTKPVSFANLQRLLVEPPGNERSRSGTVARARP